MPLIPDLDKWQFSPEYQALVNITVNKFLEVTDLLLENPNLNSSHLFRADILSDSAHILKTNAEKEVECGQQRSKPATNAVDSNDEADKPIPAPVVASATLERTIVRRLIPRNPHLDKSLTQTCHIYALRSSSKVVLNLPHAGNEAEVPWYHPPIQALAYIYDCDHGPHTSLSLRYLPFSKPTDELPATRLHRTLLSLLSTFIRLAKGPCSAPHYQAQAIDSSSMADHQPASLASQVKDTILPRHLVQNTYSTLKSKYAVDLISRWVEKTEPSKHVFEDLLIAAFLIELWKSMYVNASRGGDGSNDPIKHAKFTGFVDIACGNGILVYILIKEGYQGFGLDARRRKTWDILDINAHLHEQIIVPKPFLDVLDDGSTTSGTAGAGAANSNNSNNNYKYFHNGIFPAGTFIISNHADELTPWTPILAALASPLTPLPFLAIPCCSHALSGAKHRYPPLKAGAGAGAGAEARQTAPTAVMPPPSSTHSGDLRALRAEKAKAATHTDDKSMYACLTRKVAAIAAECGNRDVGMTLMRIPSTRNIGVVGNRRGPTTPFGVSNNNDDNNTITTSDNGAEDERRILELVERECAISGGLRASAEIWMERTRKLQIGQGRGKVNLGYNKKKGGSN